MENLVKIDASNCLLQFGNVLKEPPKSSPADRGNNILHFNRSNRPYTNNESAEEFVNTVLVPQKARALNSDCEVLQFAIAKAKELNKDSDKLYLEFGFCTGRSLNFMAALAYDKYVYGFDSLEGLPYYWRPGFEEGKFAYEDKTKIPFSPLANTTLIIGRIEETLPVFIRTEMEDAKQVDFIHIDTDIYESAKSIFEHLKDHIVPEKTVILLDEGYNYFAVEDLRGDDEWKKHEFRAANEFADRYGYTISYLGYNVTHQQLVFTFRKL